MTNVVQGKLNASLNFIPSLVTCFLLSVFFRFLKFHIDFSSYSYFFMYSSTHMEISFNLKKIGLSLILFYIPTIPSPFIFSDLSFQKYHYFNIIVPELVLGIAYFFTNFFCLLFHNSTTWETFLTLYIPMHLLHCFLINHILTF